jgi:hypothetical protein
VVLFPAFEEEVTGFSDARMLSVFFELSGFVDDWVSACY